MTDPTDFEYALHLLPPGRAGFRRWRYELWQNGTLLATGWRLSQPHAERALRTAASRFSHARYGLIPLDPARTRFIDAFWPGKTALVDCGAVRARLVPRGVPVADQA